MLNDKLDLKIQLEWGKAWQKTKDKAKVKRKWRTEREQPGSSAVNGMKQLGCVLTESKGKKDERMCN